MTTINNTCDTCGASYDLHDFDADGNVLPCDTAPDGSTYSREQLDAERGESPTLHDRDTGEAIRPATASELAASIEAAEHDGGAGIISVDGRRCYVME